MLVALEHVVALLLRRPVGVAAPRLVAVPSAGGSLGLIRISGVKAEAPAAAARQQCQHKRHEHAAGLLPAPRPS